MKAKAKAPASERAASILAAQPGAVGKLARKRSKKRFWKSKAREGSSTPGSVPRVAVGRPPKAPEDFSQNWKALRELLKQTSQTPEKPVVSQTDPKKQPHLNQQNRKETSAKVKGEEMPTKKDQEATGGSVPSGSRKERIVPVPPAEAKGAEHKKGAKKRTNGDVSLKQGNIKHKKRKAKEAAVASAPALPTEEDIWFDDVDPADIEAAIGPEAARIARRQLGQRESSSTLVKEQAFHGLTRALALDCEMVGVGPKGEESIVARVSLVNQYGKCVYDKYVKPTEPVTDYRTAVSGIRPEKLKQGMAPTVQELWGAAPVFSSLLPQFVLCAVPPGVVAFQEEQCVPVASLPFLPLLWCPPHLLKNRVVLELLCAMCSGD
ncbi:Hypothetical predicted protein [Marmota monax]|uniref:Exonuclease domain-containing protein n=1 Tax=Marmota monax TaxID=9995 RepID=A0A5E4ABM2_MARMO|nr:Hypothetical predicted protein [Marmota monax]